MRRYRQYIAVLREAVTSFTVTFPIDNERHETLRDSIIMLLSNIRSLGDGEGVIHVDAAPGLTTFKSDKILRKQNIILEIGHSKNINKNHIAEHAIQELGTECLKISPEGGPLSARLSARELWTQRPTGEQLPINDWQIIQKQHFSREHNHGFSSKVKSKNKTRKPNNINVGDLIYIASDKDKTKSRDKYLVVETDDCTCLVLKFTKSQFRSKTYEVKLTDCYPIRSNSTSHALHGPIRGIDFESHLDLDHDDMCNNTYINQPQSLHIYTEIVAPPKIVDPPNDHITHQDIGDVESNNNHSNSAEDSFSHTPINTHC